ncbi:hypothetical protein ACK8HX_02535 [Oryzobacter sp. R7]|uniref:hypothetical protein n=1 Tax=Oryzobacter faecalis TaxID=3388656 RepID=UPI00398C8401
MTRYRVDAEEVAALGVALHEAGLHLAQVGDVSAERWALGPGETGPAVEELLGGWRRSRLALAESLVALGEAALAAGDAYLDVEDATERALRGGSW